jgi:ankyrin repeat protein
MKLALLLATLLCFEGQAPESSPQGPAMITRELTSSRREVIDLETGQLSNIVLSRGDRDEAVLAALRGKGDLAYRRGLRYETLIVPRGEFAVLSEEELLASGLAGFPGKRIKKFDLPMESISSKDYLVLLTRAENAVVLFFDRQSMWSVSASWVMGQGLSVEKDRLTSLIAARRKVLESAGGSDAFGITSIRNLQGKDPAGFDFKSRELVRFPVRAEPADSPENAKKAFQFPPPHDLSYSNSGGSQQLSVASSRTAFLGRGSIRDYLGNGLTVFQLGLRGQLYQQDLTVGNVFLIETYQRKLALIRIEEIGEEELKFRWLLDRDDSGGFIEDERYWEGEAKAVPPKKQDEMPITSDQVATMIHLGALDRLKSALDAGFTVHSRDRGGYTPLHYAAGGGQLEICRLLVARGADPAAVSNDGITPLQCALRALNKNPSVIAYLTSLRDYLGLLESAEAGNVAAVNDFLARGADVNQFDSEKKTALHHAAANGHPKVIAALLEHGADPSREALLGNFTPLCFAAFQGKAESIEALLKQAKLKEEDKSRALHEATVRGHVAISRMLLQAGADPRIQLRDGTVPLDVAFRYAPREVVDVFLDAGFEIPVWAAARLGLLDRLRRGLKEGGSANATWPGGESALFLATQAGQLEAARVLLDAGANFSAYENNGYTPLHEAAEVRSKDLVQLFIARGADVNARERIGRSPLYLAVLHKQRDIAALLLAAGADPNLVPEYKGRDGIQRDSLLPLAGRDAALRKLLEDAGAR